MVDHRLKDHQGIAPDPMQFPDSWYITRLKRTLEPHTTLYKYIINQQLQATSIASHLGTTSATTISFESHGETVRIFCQTIDHTNHKALQEKNHHKALQAEFQKTGGRGRAGHQTNTGGRGDTGGRTEGHGHGDTGDGHVQGRGGRSSGRGWFQGRYHSWVLRDQFDNLSIEEYQTLIRERLMRGEIQAHHADTDPANPIPDASSTGTGVPTYPTSPAPPRSVSMAIATSNPSSTGTTISSSMDAGPLTLLRQLMSNASTCTGSTHGTTHRDTTTPNRNMSKSKGWTLQSSLITLWMEKTQVNNQTKIAGHEKLTITLLKPQ